MALRRRDPSAAATTQLSPFDARPRLHGMKDLHDS